MRIACKLALAYAVRHPLRMFLTSLAMVASASIVVWVVSGYDALSSQFGDQAAEYLGRYDFFVVPEDPKDASVDTSLVDALRQDPALAEITPVIQVSVQLMNPNAGEGGPGGPAMGGPGMGKASGGPGTGGPGGVKRAGPAGQRGARPGGMRGFRPSPMLVGTDAEKPPYPVLEGAWIDSAHPEKRGAVIGKTTAEQMNLKLGDEAAAVIYGTKSIASRSWD